MLNEADRRFVEDRKWRNRFGRPAMIAVVVVWVAFWVGLAVKVPLLANPFEVVERLRADRLDPSTSAMLAAMCPVLFSVVGVLVLLFSLLALAWAGFERRYLHIIADLSEGRPGGSVPAP